MTRWGTSQRAIGECQALKAVLRCLDFYRDSSGQALRYFKQERVTWLDVDSFIQQKEKQTIFMSLLILIYQINENLQLVKKKSLFIHIS